MRKSQDRLPQQRHAPRASRVPTTLPSICGCSEPCRQLYGHTIANPVHRWDSGGTELLCNWPAITQPESGSWDLIPQGQFTSRSVLVSQHGAAPQATGRHSAWSLAHKKEYRVLAISILIVNVIIVVPAVMTTAIIYK